MHLQKAISHPSQIINSIDTSYIKDAKALFINMPLRESALPNTMPQGVVLLATILRDKYEVDCSIIDLNGYRIKDDLSLQRNLKNGRKLLKNA